MLGTEARASLFLVLAGVLVPADLRDAFIRLICHIFWSTVDPF